MSHDAGLFNWKESVQALIESAKQNQTSAAQMIETLESWVAQTDTVSDSPTVDDQKNASTETLEAYKLDVASFFSHAIHELRNPLTSVRGYSDMLMNPMTGTLTDMQKQFMDVVRSNTRRMEGLLQDLSDMNKLRAGTLRIDLKLDMLKNVTPRLEKSLQPLADQLGRTLEIDVPQGLPFAKLDSEIVARALTRLVENGLRYHAADAEGERKVTVRGEGVDNQLQVVIEDNGIGMTTEELKHMGEIYYRSENEVVRIYKGSGLGVAAARGLLEAHGAEMMVESEPQRGTTIKIRFPAVE